jgi:hypothetical protein
MVVALLADLTLLPLLLVMFKPLGAGKTDRLTEAPVTDPSQSE